MKIETLEDVYYWCYRIWQLAYELDITKWEVMEKLNIDDLLLANNGRNNHIVGYIENDCPCCEYVVNVLHLSLYNIKVCKENCPLIDLWAKDLSKLEIEKDEKEDWLEFYNCEGLENSPYRKLLSIYKNHIKVAPAYKKQEKEYKKEIADFSYKKWREELEKKEGGWNVSKWNK